jgi:hypothetical protein
MLLSSAAPRPITKWLLAVKSVPVSISKQLADAVAPSGPNVGVPFELTIGKVPKLQNQISLSVFSNKIGRADLLP